jgi:hypothetical protein
MEHTERLALGVVSEFALTVGDQREQVNLNDLCYYH